TRPASQGVKFSRKRCSQNSGFDASCLTFDTHDLLQGVHHVDEVRLVGHDAVDVLVRARDLVEHALILAALDPAGLLLEVGAREAALRLTAAHAPPRAVRAGAQRFRVALAEHDVRARTHAPRDDPQLAFARADRALAGDVEALPEMLLPRHVVVVAVDRLA